MAISTCCSSQKNSKFLLNLVILGVVQCTVANIIHEKISNITSAVLSNDLTPLSLFNSKDSQGSLNSSIPTGYVESWRDDFNTNDINSSIWSQGLTYDKDPTHHLHWNYHTGNENILSDKYHGSIIPNNTYINNGSLYLVNKKEVNEEFSSGSINTLKKRQWNGSEKGSYLEIRAKFPHGSPKIWSSIYLNSATSWPPEIVLWEYFGVFFNPLWGQDQMHMRYVYGPWTFPHFYDNVLQKFQETYQNFQTWHTFGFQWTSKEMVWKIDKKIVFQHRKDSHVNQLNWPNETMFLVINHGLMSSVTDDEIDSNFPNYFEIDYVALYEDTK